MCEMHVCMYVRTCACMYAFMYVCMYVCVSMCMYVCIVCLYVGMHYYTYVHIYHNYVCMGIIMY